MSTKELDQAAASLVSALRAYAQASRQVIADADLPNYYFKIEVSGASHSDLKVSFHHGESRYGDLVEAFAPVAALNEHLRRKGWQARNEPLALSYAPDVPEAPELASEEPF